MKGMTNQSYIPILLDFAKPYLYFKSIDMGDVDIVDVVGVVQTLSLEKNHCFVADKIGNKQYYFDLTFVINNILKKVKPFY